MQYFPHCAGNRLVLENILFLTDHNCIKKHICIVLNWWPIINPWTRSSGCSSFGRLTQMSHPSAYPLPLSLYLSISQSPNLSLSFPPPPLSVFPIYFGFLTTPFCGMKPLLLSWMYIFTFYLGLHINKQSMLIEFHYCYWIFLPEKSCVSGWHCCVFNTYNVWAQGGVSKTLMSF